MNAQELYDLIASLAYDIEFDYQGVHGAVCPFSGTDIAVSYGENAHDHVCVADAMNDRMFNGKCLNEIAEELEMY